MQLAKNPIPEHKFLYVGLGTSRKGTTMKVSDYIIDFFAQQGIKHNFLVSGGAVIHLVDSTSKHPGIQCVCAQHEQLGAAAADGYARVAGLGLTMTTSGPGATNILTSVCNAYFDSIPLICVTGQVSRFRLKNRPGLRQRGFQETDVVSIFESVTKYAVRIADPLKIRYELEKAVYLAKEGRPGPVLLDIPDDLQRETLDPDKLEGFIPPKKNSNSDNNTIERLIALIKLSKRPALLFGAGIKVSHTQKEAIAFAKRLHIPVFFTWGGADILPHSDPQNMGVIGVCGPRGNNYGIQFSDLVISLGSRMSQMITGGKQNLFAPEAKKVMIDIDEDEIKKFDASTFPIDLAIQMNLSEFFTSFSQNETPFVDRFSQWRGLINKWRQTYPICPKKEIDETRVDPYLTVKYLSELFLEEDIIVGDTGANLCAIMQAIEPKKGQLIFSAWNHTPMGYALPASIGAQLAAPERTVHCLIGDGGFMMCMQELATLRRWDLPIKIFLFNNRGHAIQKQTIDIWLKSNYVAVDGPSGLCFPNYEALAKAFHIDYLCINNQSDLKKIHEILHCPEPMLIDIQIIETQKIIPMLKFGAGLEDLDPKVHQEEIDQAKRAAEDLELNFEPIGV